MKLFAISVLILTLSSLQCVISGRNIILIVADDLDLTLDGMFVASPICCPNRASILTGRYQHNHLTFNNSISGGCSSSNWQNTKEHETFATKLKESMSYTTFYAGKYLNQYGSKEAGGPSHHPPGWDWWAGLVGNSKYYSYSLSINGTETKYGEYPQDYLTDVISRMAEDFLKAQHPNGNPFLMVLAPPAPHAPFTPAARHNDRYKGTPAKRTPNFNTARQREKHWLVRRGPTPLPDSVLPKLDEVYRRRWETLLSVDDLVAKVYNNLVDGKLLDNTYIIFTSDNGYHIGQFGMPLDKRQPYETDIRVPLLIRGPGINPSVVKTPVSSVDFYSTILDIAGIDDSADGTSFLKKNSALDRTLLIEYHGERSEGAPSSGCPTDNDPNMSHCDLDLECKCEDTANNTYSCIRRISASFNNVFCKFDDDWDFLEAYDLNADEYQMDNIAYRMKAGLRHRFRSRLSKISTCEGNECVVTGSTPKVQLV